MNYLKSLEIAWNHSKNYLSCFKYNIFVLKNFSKSFHEYIRIENTNYKNENIETKYLSKMRKNYFLNVTNSLLELEKDLIELEDRDLKNREVKLKER